MSAQARAPAVAPESRVALSDLFLRLAAEAHDLAARSDALQDLLAGVALDGAAGDDAMEGLQEADVLSQKLRDLAAFLRALIDAAPDGTALDVAEASRRLLLGDSVRRYGAGHGALEEPGHEAGDPDLW